MFAAFYFLVALIVGPIVTRFVVLKLCEENSIRDCEGMDKFMSIFFGIVCAFFWAPLGSFLAVGFICYFVFGLLPEYVIERVKHD